MTRASRKLGWIALALIVANEIRGVAVVITIGIPILKAMFR